MGPAREKRLDCRRDIPENELGAPEASAELLDVHEIVAPGEEIRAVPPVDRSGKAAARVEAVNGCRDTQIRLDRLSDGVESNEPVTPCNTEFDQRDGLDPERLR